MELADGRDAPRHRRRRHAARVKIGEIGAQAVGRDIPWSGALGFQEGDVIGEVAPISLLRIEGGAPLRGEHVEEGVEKAMRAHDGRLTC